MTWDTQVTNQSAATVTVNGIALSSGSTSRLRESHDIVITVPSKGVLHITEPGPDDFHKLGVWTTWAVKLIAGSYVRYWGYEGHPVLPITINVDGTWSTSPSSNITFVNIPLTPSWKVTLSDTTALNCIYAGVGSDSPPTGASATDAGTIARQVYRKGAPYHRMSIMTRTTVNGKLGLTLVAGGTSRDIDADLGIGVNVSVSIAADMTYSVTAAGAPALTGSIGPADRYCVSVDGSATGMITFKSVPAVARPPPGPPNTVPAPAAGTDVYTVTFNVSVTQLPAPLSINGASVAAFAPIAGTIGRLFAVDSNGGLYISFKRKAASPRNYAIGSIVRGTSYALTIVQVNYRNWLAYVNGRKMSEIGAGRGGLFSGRTDPDSPIAQDKGVDWMAGGNLLSYEPGIDSSRDGSAGVKVEHVRFWSGTRTIDQMYLDSRLVHLHEPKLLAWYDCTTSPPTVRLGPSESPTTIQFSGNAASVARGVSPANLFFQLYQGTYSVNINANNDWIQSSAALVLQDDGTIKYAGRAVVGASISGTSVFWMRGAGGNDECMAVTFKQGSSTTKFWTDQALYCFEGVMALGEDTTGASMLCRGVLQRVYRSEWTAFVSVGQGGLILEASADGTTATASQTWLVSHPDAAKSGRQSWSLDESGFLYNKAFPDKTLGLSPDDNRVLMHSFSDMVNHRTCTWHLRKGALVHHRTGRRLVASNGQLLSVPTTGTFNDSNAWTPLRLSKYATITQGTASGTAPAPTQLVSLDSTGEELMRAAVSTAGSSWAARWFLAGNFVLSATNGYAVTVAGSQLVLQRPQMNPDLTGAVDTQGWTIDTARKILVKASGDNAGCPWLLNSDNTLTIAPAASPITDSNMWQVAYNGVQPLATGMSSLPVVSLPGAKTAAAAFMKLAEDEPSPRIKANFTVTIQTSSKWFAGTDDRIRIAFQSSETNKTTDYRALRNSLTHDDAFERDQQDRFAVSQLDVTDITTTAEPIHLSITSVVIKKDVPPYGVQAPFDDQDALAVATSPDAWHVSWIQIVNDTDLSVWWIEVDAWVRDGDSFDVTSHTVVPTEGSHRVTIGKYPIYAGTDSANDKLRERGGEHTYAEFHDCTVPGVPGGNNRTSVFENALSGHVPQAGDETKWVQDCLAPVARTVVVRMEDALLMMRGNASQTSPAKVDYGGSPGTPPGQETCGVYGTGKVHWMGQCHQICNRVLYACHPAYTSLQMLVGHANEPGLYYATVLAFGVWGNGFGQWLDLIDPDETRFPRMFYRAEQLNLSWLAMFLRAKQADLGMYLLKPSLDQVLQDVIELRARLDNDEEIDGPAMGKMTRNLVSEVGETAARELTGWQGPVPPEDNHDAL